jgi:hypothetical protein
MTGADKARLDGMEDSAKDDQNIGAGAGLIGGGTGDAELNVGAGTGIIVNADDIEVQYGETSTTACAGNDLRIPTQLENDALVGTGTPSGTNRYVTENENTLANLGPGTLQDLNNAVANATLGGVGTLDGQVPVHVGDNNLTAETFTATVGAESTEYSEYGIAPYSSRITAFTIGGVTQTGTIVDLVTLGMKSNDAALKGGDVEIWGGNALAGTSNGGDVSITGGPSAGGTAGIVELGGWNDSQYSSEVKVLAPLTTSSTIDGVDVSELSDIANMAQDTFAGRITASTGAPEELSAAQATSMLDTFSTSTTTQGVVPGSNNGGATVYLNGNGAWTTPAGGGTARDRASAAVTAATISANTLITSATNLSGALIDYQSYTFDTDLEIYINGKLMRNGTGAGSNFDVYPSAVGAEQAVGAFYCEFDIHQDDVIQMMYGTGVGSATDTFTYHEGGTYNASLSTSTWVGPPNGTVWTTAAKAQSFGTDTDPTAQPYEVGYVVPVDCNVPRIECWYRVNNTAVEGELAVYRHRWTSGSATVSTALVGSCTVASGGATGNTYDASINVDVDLLQGDRLGVYYRSAGTPAGGYTCYYTATVTMER